jgi:hypothetical protein
MKTTRITSAFKGLIAILAITAGTTSCTEKIDIELDEGYTRLVVEGIVTDDTAGNIVTLAKTTSYFYSEVPPAVSGAQVSVFDGEQTTSFSETEPGVYTAPEGFRGQPGLTYTLNILLAEEIGGYREYSAASYLNQPMIMDSIQSVFRDDWGKDGFYEIKCYAQDPTTTDFYMFKVLKNGQLMTDSLNLVFVTDDRFYNGNYTNGIGIGYLNQSYEKYKVEAGDILSVKSSRITEEYFRFVTQLQIQSGYQSPLFSGPPANIKGNINHGAIGFFAAYPVTYSHSVAPAK